MNTDIPKDQLERQIRIGKQMKEAREKKKMTQLQVAIEAEVDDNYYAMIERGEKNPSLDKICRILKVLNIKITLP